MSDEKRETVKRKYWQSDDRAEITVEVSFERVVRKRPRDQYQMLEAGMRREALATMIGPEVEERANREVKVEVTITTPGGQAQTLTLEARQFRALVSAVGKAVPSGRRRLPYGLDEDDDAFGILEVAG